MPISLLTNGESGLGCRTSLNQAITMLNAASLGGNGTADSGKLALFTADGGMNLGKSDVVVAGLAILTTDCDLGDGIKSIVRSNGNCFWAYPLGTNSSGFHTHAGAGTAILGFTTDLTAATHGTDNISLVSLTHDDDFAFLVQARTAGVNSDRFCIRPTGDLEAYASGTDHSSGSDKTVISFTTPSGTGAITVPAGVSGPICVGYGTSLQFIRGDGSLGTIEVGFPIVTKFVSTGSYTVGTTDPLELYGGIIYVTGGATIVCPAVATGASFTVITIGAVAVSVDPNASDLIVRDGTAQADGEKITNLSTAGDIAVLTYYNATGWSAATNAWTNGG